MDLHKWAACIAECLMPHGRRGEPIHLFLTRSELVGLADDEQDLLSDLRVAVAMNPPADPSRHERRRAESWRSGRDPDEPPPGLPFVVAEVLVCGEQVEAGSLAFYQPLSDALGCQIRIADLAYEQCFAPFWSDLTWWLETINAGDRGFPTWKSIPTRGPRSIIGRPYTQMLLHREDWRDLEAFMDAFGEDEVLDFEVVDRERLAGLLLTELRRWVARERRVSPRLLAILATNRQGDLDTLSFLLLEGLTNARAQRDASSVRSLPLVVTLDDWDDRTLRVGVVAPPEPTTVAIAEELLTLDEPRWPYPTGIAMTSDFLADGATVQAMTGQVLIYRPHDAIALAERTWDLWASVNSVEAGERVYVLCKDDIRPRVERLMQNPGTARGISGVPDGWALLGPSPIAAPGSSDSALVGLRRHQALVPTLAGGLRVQQGRVYLEGAPPDVIFPTEDADRNVVLDGAVIKHDSAKVLTLTELQLSVGRHTVTVDGMLSLNFDLVDPGWAGTQQPQAWRGADGSFVADTERVRVSGVLAEPRNERWLPLLPVTSEAVVVGDSPYFHTFVPTQAPWAASRGLPFDFFDPLDRMSYAAGRRPPFVPFLAAARLSDGHWEVVALPGFENIDPSSAEPSWAAMVNELMAGSHLRHDPTRPVHQETWTSLREALPC